MIVSSNGPEMVKARNPIAFDQKVTLLLLLYCRKMAERTLVVFDEQDIIYKKNRSPILNAVSEANSLRNEFL